MFRARSGLLRELREFFYQRGFLEVQTPILSQNTMVDRTIEPIPVPLEGMAETFYLQSSPEFAMKRLLLQGIDPIFEITSAFRNAERGANHNPEFTLLEWYRIGDNYSQGRELLAELACACFPDKSLEQVTYRELFAQHVGLNPHTASVESLIESCRNFQIETSSSFDKDFLLQMLMSEIIEPTLQGTKMFMVFDWPESQSALAKVRTIEEKNSEFKVAERFELYIDSLEIANGYHELCDPREQRDRMIANNQYRESAGLPALPVQSFLLDEMQEQPLPDCCGVALGFDRLLMLKTQAKQIADVISFPIESA